MTQPTADYPRPADLRQALPIGDEELSISEVCELLGITTHTARYYERAGLLEVARSRSGHRAYDSVTVERLDFLVRMRTSGMGISQLKRYVELVRAGETTTSQRLQIMVDQRERILSQIDQLELALATTDYKIAKYGGVPGDDRRPTNTTSNTTRSERGHS
ncbi:MAG: MerR family transcriptional regulator [Kocuria sp.]|nr:MerR family transcriptional regulator [Kocuria sp.]